jgi:hypothetical protein
MHRRVFLRALRAPLLPIHLSESSRPHLFWFKFLRSSYTTGIIPNTENVGVLEKDIVENHQAGSDALRQQLHKLARTPDILAAEQVSLN